MSVFTDRLIGLRKDNGLSQEKLCERIGIGRDKLSQWERELRFPDINELKLLCDILGCDAGYLMGEYAEKHAVTASIRKQTGLSEPAINILQSENQQQYPCIDSRILSELIESRELLTMLCSCAAREYDTVPAAGYEPFETQRHELLMLYDALCDFIESYRQKHGLDTHLFEVAALNRRLKRTASKKQ